MSTRSHASGLDLGESFGFRTPKAELGETGSDHCNRLPRLDFEREAPALIDDRALSATFRTVRRAPPLRPTPRQTSCRALPERTFHRMEDGGGFWMGALWCPAPLTYHSAAIPAGLLHGPRAALPPPARPSRASLARHSGRVFEQCGSASVVSASRNSVRAQVLQGPQQRPLQNSQDVSKAHKCSASWASSVLRVSGWPSFRRLSMYWFATAPARGVTPFCAPTTLHDTRPVLWSSMALLPIHSCPYFPKESAFGKCYALFFLLLSPFIGSLESCPRMGAHLQCPVAMSQCAGQADCSPLET